MSKWIRQHMAKSNESVSNQVTFSGRLTSVFNLLKDSGIQDRDLTWT